MTAEIAVMNKLGVALAADSAISIPTSANTKIYHSNKLFMLSKYEPVGLMVYGSGELMGVPWELIIKSYRRDLGSTSFKTLEEYGVSFISFLNNSRALFPPEAQADYVYEVTYGFFNMIKEQIDESVEEVIHKALRISLSNIRAVVSQTIKVALKFIERHPRPNSMPVGFEKRVLAKYYQIIEQSIEDVFQKLPLSTQLRKDLRRIGIGLFARDMTEFRNYSGIVIGGFGADDIFPAIVAYDIEGVVDDTVKYVPSAQNTRVKPDNSCALIPFAQKEMVISFVEGASPAYRDTLRQYLEKLFDSYPRHVVKKIPHLTVKQRKDLIKDLKAEGGKLAEKFWQNLEGWAAEYNIMPILNTIGVLPLEELASMAESLVNLTSFKRRVSLDAETVGGPIDVAVISKGDGFIWIKRTRYFDPERNPHFFRNYYT
jgi:hypothetical protein